MSDGGTLERDVGGPTVRLGDVFEFACDIWGSEVGIQADTYGHHKKRETRKTAVRKTAKATRRLNANYLRRSVGPSWPPSLRAATSLPPHA